MTMHRDTEKKVIALIKMGEKVLETTTEGYQKQYLHEKKFHDFRISALSFLSVTFGDHSLFYKEFYKEVTTPTPNRCERGLGILAAVQREMQGEWLVSMRGEIFGALERDLLGIAKKHLAAGKKQAALTFAVSLLDNHLQNLCTEKGLNIMRETDGGMTPYTTVQLNSRAYKKGLYERKANKKIFAWLELHEKSLGAEVSEITDEQVLRAIDGIAAFFVEQPTRIAE